MNEPRIVKDNAHCFGNPRLDGTNIPVHAVVDRFMAGEHPSDLQTDYEITVAQFEAVIRYALNDWAKDRDEVLALLREFVFDNEHGEPCCCYEGKSLCTNQECPGVKAREKINQTVMEVIDDK